jgi:hypothetical protein
MYMHKAKGRAEGAVRCALRPAKRGLSHAFAFALLMARSTKTANWLRREISDRKYR